ncbi:MAG TPA: 30S ribosomal protein S17 [Candidatus Angelobacter sp.]|jgi:small subunit ribosomal protein S17|nr:30S ribosomal protein S17 [Candidatus Angelobacter sp.]
MAETTATTEKKQGRRATKIGRVVSTKMAKTIVVQVSMKKSHPLYRRVIQKAKKFYAHDEEKTARVGDFVEIEETRPLSKLKRWKLKNVLQRAKLVAGEESLDSKTA